MKWVFLAAITILTLVAIALLRSDRKLVRWAAFGLGLLPFVETYLHLFAAPIAWFQWEGTVKGIAISASDALAFAVLITSPKANSPTRLRIAFGLIMLAYTVSTLASGVRIESLFFGWEIVRALLVYFALLRATAADEEVPVYLLNGLIAGLLTQAVVALSQYAGGVTQAPGWFDHQNLLGYTTHFVVYSAFAAFLAGFYTKRTMIAVLGGLIIAFTGGSRATIGLMVAGLGVTALFSIWHHRTGRKFAVVGAAFIAVALVSPALYLAVQRRSAEQLEGSNSERELMKSAASMIVSDYPLGAGPNRYVIVANLGGYSEKAGVPWNRDNRAAPVHNSYYLAAAEMGWLGLAALMTLLVAGLSAAVRLLRRAPPGLGGELAAGTAAAMMMIAIHAYYEWIFFAHSSLYFLALTLGLLAGLTARLRRRSRKVMTERNPLSQGAAKPAQATAIG